MTAVIASGDWITAYVQGISSRGQAVTMAAQ